MKAKKRQRISCEKRKKKALIMQVLTVFFSLLLNV